ncbi:MAG: phage protein Gp27 family protein [Pseudomonadota bacterium]
MARPRKIDLIPAEDREWLAEELAGRGFAGIEEVTDLLNARSGVIAVGISVGKSAVGEFSKELKIQRALRMQSEAFDLAGAMMGDMDVDQESALYKGLTQMIATLAMQSLMAAPDNAPRVPAEELMLFGRVLKDLTGSAGGRVRLEQAERDRIAKEAREAAQAEVKERVEDAVSETGLSGERAEELRRKLLGVR